ncbi:unnamed protein product, partial [Rotaria sp. Silwood2]
MNFLRQITMSLKVLELREEQNSID